MPFTICRIVIMSRLISDQENCGVYAVLFCHFIGKLEIFLNCVFFLFLVIFFFFVLFFAYRFQAEMAPYNHLRYPTMHLLSRLL